MKDVLLEARELVRGERAKFYGDPAVNFQAIADLWDTYLVSKLEYRGVNLTEALVTPFDVCQLMVLLKTARGARGYHRDSTVDVAGYAALAEIVEDPAAHRTFAAEAGL